jgi:hypothetical protein
MKMFRNVVAAMALIFAVGGADKALASESECQLIILVVQARDFTSFDGAQRFCDPFQGFCSVRQFSDRHYEGDFRYRHTFRGSDRRAVFSSYHDFIGRNRFSAPGFRHSFSFRGCK